MVKELKPLDMARLIHTKSNKRIKVKDALDVLGVATEVMEEELGNGNVVKLGSLVKLKLVVHKAFRTHNVVTREISEVPEKATVKVTQLSGVKRASDRFLQQ